MVLRNLLLLSALLVPGACAAAEGVAVVELFTSEGCSSCPPADRLLADLAHQAGASHRPVYALEFHVDYWNSLGWRDPFSDAAFTARQRDYAAALGLEQVYTPQMIVDGRAEFVGSNRARAEREIADALARPARATVALRRHGTQLEYRVTGAPPGARVCLAEVDSAASTQVRRGENAGRTLAHAQVVRAFQVRALGGDGAGRFDLRRASAPGEELIVFVQDPRSGEILGAGSDR